MSFSFHKRASSKADLKAAVAEELDRTVQQQPIHAADRDAAQSAADAHIDLLVDDEDSDYQISVNGSAYGTDDGLEGTGLAVTTSRVARARPAA